MRVMHMRRGFPLTSAEHEPHKVTIRQDGCCSSLCNGWFKFGGKVVFSAATESRFHVTVTWG